MVSFNVERLADLCIRNIDVVKNLGFRGREELVKSIEIVSKHFPYRGHASLKEYRDHQSVNGNFTVKRNANPC